MYFTDSPASAAPAAEVPSPLSSFSSSLSASSPLFCVRTSFLICFMALLGLAARVAVIEAVAISRWTGRTAAQQNARIVLLALEAACASGKGVKRKKIWATENRIFSRQRVAYSAATTCRNRRYRGQSLGFSS